MQRVARVGRVHRPCRSDETAMGPNRGYVEAEPTRHSAAGSRGGSRSSGKIPHGCAELGSSHFEGGMIGDFRSRGNRARLHASIPKYAACLGERT